MSEFDTITALLQREGWPIYTNHGADRGGPTKGGVTLMSWARYQKRSPAIDPQTNEPYGGIAVTPEEIQGLTETDVRKFYRNEYIIGPNFHRIEDPQLRDMVIDAGVQHSPERAAKWLQQAADVKADGVIGEVTLAAVNAAQPLELFIWMAAYRTRLYGRLTTLDPELKKARAAGIRLQAENTAGWCNRLAGFLESAAKAIEADHNATWR